VSDQAVKPLRVSERHSPPQFGIEKGNYDMSETHIWSYLAVAIVAFFAAFIGYRIGRNDERKAHQERMRIHGERWTMVARHLMKERLNGWKP
jgi:hypothetical protein